MGNTSPRHCSNSAVHNKGRNQYDDQADRLEPMGNVFDDTLGEVAPLDRQLLAFAGGGNVVFVRWLLLLGANPRVVDKNGTTPLHVAARSGSVMIVRDLLARGALVNAKDNFMWTPLHIACSISRRRVMRDLLDAFADINSRTLKWQSPLHLAEDRKAKFIILQSLSAAGDIIAGKLSAKNHRSNRNSILSADDDRIPTCKGKGVLGDTTIIKRYIEVDPDDDEWLVKNSKESGADFIRDKNYLKEKRDDNRRKLARKLRQSAQLDVKTNLESALRCDPLFIPREALVHEKRFRNELADLGIHFFNKQPGSGLAFLVSTGCVYDFPIALSLFMERRQCHPDRIGGFLAEGFSLAQTLRMEFLNSIDFLETGVVSMLRTLFGRMQLPPDLQKIDRVFFDLALVWWKQIENKMRNKERQRVESKSLSAAEVASVISTAVVSVDTQDPNREVFPDTVSINKKTNSFPQKPSSQNVFEEMLKRKRNEDSGKLSGLSTSSRRVERIGAELFQDLRTPEALHQLLCACLMLYWNVHSKTKLCRLMQYDEWVVLNDGIEDLYNDIDVIGTNVPGSLLHRLYEVITDGAIPEIDRGVIVRRNDEPYSAILDKIWDGEKKVNEARMTNTNTTHGCQFDVNAPLNTSVETADMGGTLNGTADAATVTDTINKSSTEQYEEFHLDPSSHGFSHYMSLEFCDKHSKPIDVQTLISNITGNTAFDGLIFLKKQHFVKDILTSPSSKDLGKNSIGRASSNGPSSTSQKPGIIPNRTECRSSDCLTDSGSVGYPDRSPYRVIRVMQSKAISMDGDSPQPTASRKDVTSGVSKVSKQPVKAGGVKIPPPSDSDEEKVDVVRGNMYSHLSSLMAENTPENDYNAQCGGSGGTAGGPPDLSHKRTGRILATFDSMLYEQMLTALQSDANRKETGEVGFVAQDATSVRRTSIGRQDLSTLYSEQTGVTLNVARWADVVLKNPQKSRTRRSETAEVKQDPRNAQKSIGKIKSNESFDNVVFIALACGLLLMSASPEEGVFAFLNLRDERHEDIVAKIDECTDVADQTEARTKYKLVLRKKSLYENMGFFSNIVGSKSSEEKGEHAMQVVLLFHDGRWDTFLAPIIRLGVDTELRRVQWINKINTLVKQGILDRESAEKEKERSMQDDFLDESDTETIG